MPDFSIKAGQTLHGTTDEFDAASKDLGPDPNDVSYSVDDTANFSITKTGKNTADVTCNPGVAPGTIVTVTSSDGTFTATNKGTVSDPPVSIDTTFVP